MPDATKFSAYAHGNGFPFCPEKVRVDFTDYWTTLGGYNKDASTAVTAAQIHLSRVNAMKLFWNFHQINTYLGTTYMGSASAVDANTEDDAVTPTEIGEPKERVCIDDRHSIEHTAYPSNGSEWIWADIQPVRMYDGVTTDEDNFIGYGINGNGFDAPSIFVEVTDGFQIVTVQLFSFGYWITSPMLGLDEIAYITFQGIHFVCGTTVLIDPMTGGGVTSSPASLTADDGYGLSAKIDSFDFYTYP